MSVEKQKSAFNKYLSFTQKNLVETYGWMVKVACSLLSHLLFTLIFFRCFSVTPHLADGSSDFETIIVNKSKPLPNILRKIKYDKKENDENEPTQKKEKYENRYTRG